MKKVFRELRIGERFYESNENQGMNLQRQLIKVDTLKISRPEQLAGITERAKKKGMFNCVIVSDADNWAEGYYDLVPFDSLVWPQNLLC